ncbi:hypothetical protein [Kribbella sp. CA-293567]|uniref:hypothetical protein n=1 Tax=Kribbella sp. CA-293567 TaxID=3002436 RepID=UPI0022DE11D5|nr:hypothetical protein [Kribbella sp. CA-293567]WBQ08041.1 hypothetical protein OX958_14835 [Kribbella sp. CA-293567]
MTTKLRRTVARAAGTGLAILVLGGAAAGGASAALPQNQSSCAANPVARALDVALSVRSALDPDRATTC